MNLSHVQFSLAPAQRQDARIALASVRVYCCCKITRFTSKSSVKQRTVPKSALDAVVLDVLDRFARLVGPKQMHFSAKFRRETNKNYLKLGVF